MTVDATKRYPHLFAPLDVGTVSLKHRIVATPHGAVWGGTNIPSSAHVAYYAERAKGGAALVCVGVTLFHRRHAGNLARPRVASETAVVPLYVDMAEAIHRYGCKVFIELAENGVHGFTREGVDRWHPVWGPSPIPSVVRNQVPALIDREFIDELVTDVAKAATNLVSAGIDGVTLHAAHSYLLGQFMSPAYNIRTDEFGGSNENRCRLAVLLAQSVRDAVGDAIAVGIRLSYDEYIGKAGLHPDLSDEYLAILCETGLFDFFDISAGGYHSLERSVPPMRLPPGHIVEHGLRARHIVDGRGAVIVAGRIRTANEAEMVLSSGAADLVGMTRAQIADPFLVTKILEAREDEIDGCVGANECIFNLHLGQGLACAVNPVVGREEVWGSGTLVKAGEDARRRWS